MSFKEIVTLSTRLSRSQWKFASLYSTCLCPQRANVAIYPSSDGMDATTFDALYFSQRDCGDG